MAVHKILIPLDTSSLSEQILPAVRQLFTPTQTALTLFVVLPLPEGALTVDAAVSIINHAEAEPAFDQAPWERRLKLAEAALHTQAQPLQAAGYTVTTLVRGGDPVQEIITCLEGGAYDLVAMSTHGHTGSARQLMGHVAERLLRRVQRPILFLRPFAESTIATTLSAQARPAPVTGRTMTVAMATDGSTHAQQARRLAVELAQAFRAELQVLVVGNEHEEITAAQQLVQDVYQRLGDLAQTVQLVPLVGRTDIVIERYLSEHPVDLLVIGAFNDRGSGPIAHIGRTAQEIVQHLPLSVLIAKGRAAKPRKLLALLTDEDQAVIEVAAQWAKLLRADLRFLHVLPPVGKPPQPISPPLAELSLNEILARGLFRRAQSRLADEIKVMPVEAVLAGPTPLTPFLPATLAHLAAVGVDRNALLLRSGPPVRTILYVAEQEQADLLIVGGQTAPAFLLDSTASAVVQLAPHSVLVVRTPRQP